MLGQLGSQQATKSARVAGSGGGAQVKVRFHGMLSVASCRLDIAECVTAAADQWMCHVRAQQRQLTVNLLEAMGQRAPRVGCVRVVVGLTDFAE